jgi:hypothetical protein
MSKKKFHEKLKRFLSHPKVSLVVSLVVIMSGVFEFWDSSLEAMLGHEIGARHGIIFFGLFQALNAVVEILERAETMGEAA